MTASHGNPPPPKLTDIQKSVSATLSMQPAHQSITMLCAPTVFVSARTGMILNATVVTRVLIEDRCENEKLWRALLEHLLRKAFGTEPPRLAPHALDDERRAALKSALERDFVSEQVPLEQIAPEPGGGPLHQHAVR